MVGCGLMRMAGFARQKIRQGFNPDRILSDMMMPLESGKVFYEWLERERPELARRLSFVSAGSDRPELQKFLDGFGGRVVEKPYSHEEIRDVLTSPVFEGK